MMRALLILPAPGSSAGRNRRRGESVVVGFRVRLTIGETVMPEKASKNVLASLTVWGIIVAGAGVIADANVQMTELLGGVWGPRVVLIAGLVMAFAGRLRASKSLRIGSGAPLLGLVCVLPVLIGGCAPKAHAGEFARAQALYPAMRTAWPGVRADADRGIQDRIDDGEISEGVGVSLRERLSMFDEAFGALD